MKSTRSSPPSVRRARQAPPPDVLLRLGVGASAVALAAIGLAHACFGLEPLLLSDWLPGCVFRTLTGLPCPGCGMTHALLLLTQLRIAESFAAHPAALPLTAATSLWLLRPSWARSWQGNPVLGVMLAALLLLWLGRVAQMP